MSIDADSEDLVDIMFRLEAWMMRHTKGAVYEEGADLVGDLIEAVREASLHLPTRTAELTESVRAALEVRGCGDIMDEVMDRLNKERKP